MADGVTGTFFREQTVDGLRDAIDRCERMDFAPPTAVAHAAAFGTGRFMAEMGAFVDSALDRHRH